MMGWVLGFFAGEMVHEWLKRQTNRERYARDLEIQARWWTMTVNQRPAGLTWGGVR